MIRQDGVSSEAQHALEWEEFISLQFLAFCMYITSDLWFHLMVLLCMPRQIIGCIDDVMILAKATLVFNMHKPSALR